MSDDPIKGPVKLLVGHINPDMDVIGAMWLFMRFGSREFETATLYFVPAGEGVDEDTLRAKNLDKNEVVCVDTGLGPFDHHQPGNQTHDSATSRVYDYLVKKNKDLASDEALRRVVEFVNETDHFGSFWWPEPMDDRYVFMLEEILAGLRSGRHFNDQELVEFGMVCLDGIYTSMKIKVSAEEDIKEKGREFDTVWGRALAIENKNDEVIKLGQKQGHVLVVRKDAEEGHVRIKAVPKKEVNLRKVFEKIVECDSEGTWYYHPSGHMVLNKSEKHEKGEATKLSLEEVVEIVQGIAV